MATEQPAEAPGQQLAPAERVLAPGKRLVQIEEGADEIGI